MAGYRPKSLEDINQSYDSEMTVTRAIKRETTKLSKSAPSVAEVFSQPKAKEETDTLSFNGTAEKPMHVEDLSFAVEDFIKQLSGESTAPAKPVVQSTAPVVHHEPQIKHEASFEEPKATPAPVITHTVKAKEPVFIPDPGKARSNDDFSDLMSDYVKIMNDLDEDTTEKRGFLSRKRAKKKAAKKEIIEEISEEIAEELPEDNEQENIFEEISEPEAEPQAQEEPEETDTQSSVEEFLAEISNSDEASDFEKTSFKAEDEEPGEAETDDYFGSFAELIDEDFEEPNEAEDEPVKEKKHKSKKDKKAKKAEKRKEKELAKEEPAEEPEPELQEEQAEPEIELEYEEEPQESTKKSHNGVRIFFRVLLTPVLIASILATVAVGSMGMVFHVNEGVRAPGNLYFFTTSRDFADTSIKAEDLVICKGQNTASDGQKVVYVDRENRIFSFGIKSGSITGTDGEIYYVIGNSTVMRENVLGTVTQTVPKLGGVINLAYSYYIPVLGALLAICIVLFLVVTVALRNRNKALKADYEEEYDEYIQAEEPELTENTEAEPQQESTEESDEFATFFADL